MRSTPKPSIVEGTTCENCLMADSGPMICMRCGVKLCSYCYALHAHAVPTHAHAVGEERTTLCQQWGNFGHPH
jgi:hypothetical protein